MQAQPTASLPEFSRPPVTEVIIAVEFVPISNWQVPHAGLYWSRIKDRYPFTEVHPPLFPQPEPAGDDIFQPQQSRFEFFSPSTDAGRMWFLSKDKTNLIQIQRDRFIVNWRQVSGLETYPRFDATIRPRFVSEFAEFRRFLDESSLKMGDVTFCEVTYVNDVVKGKDWSSLDEAMSYFSFGAENQKRDFLGELETISVSGTFKMSRNRGRLRFSALHAMRPRDKAQIIQLNLSARGRPPGQSEGAILEWVDAGRECVVRGFTELTTTKAHERWGRNR